MSSNDFVDGTRENHVDVFEAVRTVLAVRSFRDEPIPDEVVLKVVEAGRLSASARNRQPWHFVVVDDPELIGQMADVATSGPYISQAQVVVAVALEKTTWAESDVSRAVQSMILTAWSEGVGSNWVGFYNLDGVNTLLGIPGELKVLALLPLGYPVDAIGKGNKKRKPLAEVASRNRFGEPFSQG